MGDFFDLFTGLVLVIFFVVMNTRRIQSHSMRSPFHPKTKKTGAYTPQVIDLTSIDSSRNRYRCYRIIRRGTVVRTMHGRSAPGESPYLKGAKPPQTFDTEDEALDYVEDLIRSKVNRRTDPYCVVDSSEASS